MSGKKERSETLPGDKIAVSEEFLRGAHTYEERGQIRSLVAGKVQKNMKEMEISVAAAREPDVIKVGDWISGQVEAAQSNSANVKLYFLNGELTHKDFSGMLNLRGLMGGGGRGMRRSTPVKSGDVVRARVFSLLNGIIHLTIDEPDMGVIAALCSNCGRPLLLGNSTRAKCDECGNVEERKLAADFGSYPIQP